MPNRKNRTYQLRWRLTKAHIWQIKQSLHIWTIKWCTLYHLWDHCSNCSKAVSAGNSKANISLPLGCFHPRQMAVKAQNTQCIQGVLSEDTTSKMSLSSVHFVMWVLPFFGWGRGVGGWVGEGVWRGWKQLWVTLSSHCQYFQVHSKILCFSKKIKQPQNGSASTRHINRQLRKEKREAENWLVLFFPFPSLNPLRHPTA